MPETVNDVAGAYVNVIGSAAVTVLMPAICHPPTRTSSADDMLPPTARPLPIGSAHTKLVVLLYGWSYAPVAYSASRLRKSCGAGKFPFWFSSDCAPLSLAFDSV